LNPGCTAIFLNFELIPIVTQTLFETGLDSSAFLLASQCKTFSTLFASDFNFDSHHAYPRFYLSFPGNFYFAAKKTHQGIRRRLRSMSTSVSVFL
jgi:hypothetical protein